MPECPVGIKGCKQAGNAYVCGLCPNRTVKAPAVVTPGQSKHRAVICEADQIRFPSKKHRAYYLQLQAERAAGMIRFFLREVPFDLPGHFENGRVVRHWIDFEVIKNDGTVRWVEVKGRDLPLGKIKRLQVEELYGIRVELI